MNLQKLFLTFFGSGLSPIAPGTVGTLASIPFGLLVIIYLGTSTLNTLVLVVTIIAIFEINKYEKNGGEHDAKWIVIDESVGVWLTQAISYEGIMKLSIANYQTALIVTTILSFILFRLFDIWKPSTIGYIDRKVKGGAGVVLDDILAGIAAAMMALVIFNILAYYKINLNAIFGL